MVRQVEAKRCRLEESCQVGDDGRVLVGEGDRKDEAEEDVCVRK
jgi:hypothetical protein